MPVINARDFLGNTLNIDDEVVFLQIGYRNFIKGKIIKISDKKATVSHAMTNVCSMESIQFHNQLIKVINPCDEVKKEGKND